MGRSYNQICDRCFAMGPIASSSCAVYYILITKRKAKLNNLNNKKQFLSTLHFQLCFGSKIKLSLQASTLHEGQQRWNDQVFAGAQMDKSLRYIGNEKV